MPERPSDYGFLWNNVTSNEQIVTSVEEPCPHCGSELSESQGTKKNRVFFTLHCASCKTVWNVRWEDEVYA